MAAIEMIHIVKQYGDGYPAVNDVTLDVGDGEFMILVGPSGCGKSTLLRALNRMYSLYPEQRAEGQLLLDGRNILESDVDVIDLRARIGMVFQKPTPFPMSIYQNIAFGVSMHEKLTRGEIY